MRAAIIFFDTSARYADRLWKEPTKRSKCTDQMRRQRLQGTWVAREVPRYYPKTLSVLHSIRFIVETQKCKASRKTFNAKIYLELSYNMSHRPKNGVQCVTIQGQLSFVVDVDLQA